VKCGRCNKATDRSENVYIVDEIISIRSNLMLEGHRLWRTVILTDLFDSKHQNLGGRLFVLRGCRSTILLPTRNRFSGSRRSSPMYLDTTKMQLPTRENVSLTRQVLANVMATSIC
jgi:hypothetical protein